MPGFSPRLDLGCRFGTAGLKSIARNFNAALLRCMDLSRQPPGRCPLFHRDLISVVSQTHSGAAGLKSIARNFNALLLRLSLRRGRAEIHCPKLQRSTTSVHGFVAATHRALPAFSPRPCFGCHSGAAGLKSIARNFNAPCFRLSLRRGGAEIHCPKLQRGTTSVHGFVAAAARALPAFSPRPCFGCRSGAAGQKIIARNFNAALLRCMDLSRQLTGRCPVFHRGLAFGCRFGAAGLKSIARNFNAPCFRLSLRRGRAETRCPKLQRGTTSVHGFVAAFARALPGFPPRLDLGCRFGAAGRKLVARNFSAALLRLSLRRGQAETR